MYSIWEKNSFIHYDCIIVGSGILGLSTAISMKDKSPSTEVLILERGTLPSGASTKNAGFACFGSLTEILSDIKRIGENETLSLVEKRWKGINMLRQRLGDEKMGLLNYGGSELLKESHIFALDEIGHVNHLLKNVFDSDTFIADEKKIGEFGFDRDLVKSLVFSPFESQIDTGLLMRSLIAMAQSKGVMIINNFDAVIDDDSSSTVKVSAKNSGVTFTSNRLISCSNAFTSTMFPQIEIKPGRGQVIATKPLAGLQIKGVFHMDEGYYYFRNYGERIIFGGGRNLDFEGEETSEFGNTDMIIKSLMNILGEVILPGREFEVEMTWSGIMGFNESKLPEIIQVSDNITVGFCCNGMGVALASYVAEQLSESGS
jgi:glycine/D-amino acid oxidase-like deaminating enzyme